MEKLFQQVKKEATFSSALYIAAGLVLLIWPVTAEWLLSFLLGAGLIVYGVAKVYDYFKASKVQAVWRHDLAVGLLAVFVGIFLMLTPRIFLELLHFLLGMGILINGFVKLQYAFDMKKAGYKTWTNMLIMGGAMCLIGIVCIFYAGAVADLFVRIMGGCFIIAGGTDIYTVMSIRAAGKK